MDERRNDEGRATGTPAGTSAPVPRRRFWKRAGIATLAAGLIAGVGACSAGAYHHRHWGGWHGGEASAERMQQGVERGVERALKDTDATDEQKARIRDIALAAVQHLRGMRQAQRELRSNALDLMGRADLDRAAIEQLRARQMQLADDASRRVAQALGDMAEVLTPAQRATVTERLREKLGRRWG